MQRYVNFNVLKEYCISKEENERLVDPLSFLFSVLWITLSCTYLFVVIIDIDMLHLSQLCCKALGLIVTLPLENVVFKELHI